MDSIETKYFNYSKLWRILSSLTESPVGRRRRKKNKDE